MAFNLKQNDTSPSIQTTLLDGNGFAVDITGNLGVTFHMRDSAGTVVIDTAATVITAATGIVRYDWLPADTATSGTFQAEFEVTYSDGKVETFPNASYIEVIITDDIA
jgi:hypothetical protein